MTSEKDLPGRGKTDQAGEGRPTTTDDKASPEPAETMEATTAQAVNGEDGTSQPVESALEEANEAEDEEPQPNEEEPGKGKPVAKVGVQSGAFQILDVPGNDEEFNIKPKDRPEPIPEEQSEIANGIYETWGVLKLLREQGVFNSKNDQQVFREFRQRLVEVAQVGLAANHVKTRTAAKALEQIRQGIILRKGVAIKLAYLLQLAIWSFYGIFAGVVLIVLSGTGSIPATLAGYGWVLIGAMVGAWMSVASTRRALAFHEIAEYLSSTREPIVRLLFVGFLAMTLALMITYGVITLDMGKASLAEFHEKRGVAVLIGLIAGIGEKAVSLRIIERVQKTVTTGSS